MKYIKFTLILLFAALLSACGSGGNIDSNSDSDTGSIAFNLQFEKPSQKLINSKLIIANNSEAISYGATGDVCVDYGISTVSGYVYTSAGAQIASGGPWQCSAHQGTITNVTTGGGYTVRFEGANSGGAVIYRGEKTNINVNGGQTTDVGTITMGKIYQFVTKWGSYGTGSGQFMSPWGVTVDSSGNVYVADNNNARIQKFSQ